MRGKIHYSGQSLREFKWSFTRVLLKNQPAADVSLNAGQQGARS